METLRNSETIPSTMTDSAIIGRILSGETELFEILLRRNNQILYRTLRSYLSKEADIEDIMQETYLKAYQKLYQFKHDSLFSTWLIRIGINEALQKIRKSDRMNLVDITEERNVFQIADNSVMDTESKMSQLESAGFIEKAFETLPEKYRIVFMLKEVEGMEISEIAKCLEISNTNVKVRLHRSRSMMKDSLLNVFKKSDLFEFGNSKCDLLVANVMRKISEL